MIDKGMLYRTNFSVGGRDGPASGDSGGKSGNNGDARDRAMGLQGKTGTRDKSLDTGGGFGKVDRSKVSQFSQYGKNVMAKNLDPNLSFDPRSGTMKNKFSPSMMIGGLTSLLTGVPGLGLAVTGLKKGFDFLGDSLQDLRGFNPDGSPRTQQEYEDYMAEKSLQNRFDNLMDRKLTGKSYSEKNLQSLMDMGLTSSKDSLASAIERDLAINPETTQLSRSYIQSLAQPNVTTFANPIGPRAVNVPGAGITGIDVNLPGNDLMAGLTKMQQKMLAGPQKNLRNIMGISDQEILNNISPFNDPNDPATLEEVQEFYRT